VEIVMMVVLLVLLDLAALRWGADSRDGLGSPEARLAARGMTCEEPR